MVQQGPAQDGSITSKPTGMARELGDCLTDYKLPNQPFPHSMDLSDAVAPRCV